MSDLKGKTVIVTGGARRLGGAIAASMAQAGASVGFTFRSSSIEAAQTLNLIRDAGVRGLSVSCDIRDDRSVRQAAATFLDHFGQIDILVNNAGIFQTAKLEEITVEQWDEVFAVNVRGPFLMSRDCSSALRRVHGRIINLGSLGGERPWATHAHYCSSKAALHMLTQVMAKAFAPEVAVNCVAPGMIDAGDGGQDPGLLDRLAVRTPLKKNGTPQDVVNAVMYFAGAPHFVTGQVLTVDGGLGLV